MAIPAKIAMTVPISIAAAPGFDMIASIHGDARSQARTLGLWRHCECEVPHSEDGIQKITLTVRSIPDSSSQERPRERRLRTWDAPRWTSKPRLASRLRKAEY